MVCPYLITDLSETDKVYESGIGACSGNNDSGFRLLGQLEEFVVVDPFCLLIDSVLDDVEALPREARLVAVG